MNSCVFGLEFNLLQSMLFNNLVSIIFIFSLSGSQQNHNNSDILKKNLEIIEVIYYLKATNSMSKNN